MALVHVGEALQAVARVLDHGDKKYGIAAWLDNGKTADFNLWDHIKGIERHLARRNRGEIVDESGELALAHVVARGLLALTFELQIRETEQKECGEALIAEGSEMTPRAICTLTEKHQPAHLHYDAGEDMSWSSYVPEEEAPSLTEGDPR